MHIHAQDPSRDVAVVLSVTWLCVFLIFLIFGSILYDVIRYYTILYHIIAYYTILYHIFSDFFPIFYFPIIFPPPALRAGAGRGGGAEKKNRKIKIRKKKSENIGIITYNIV